MTHTPNTWRPAGASDHPDFTEAERMHLRELAGKIAAASSTATDQAREPVVHVTFWSLTERALAVRAMEVVASSDAAEGAGTARDVLRSICKAGEELGCSCADQNYQWFDQGCKDCIAKAYKKLLASAPPKPAPDAVREAIAEIFYEVMPYDMYGLAFMGKPAWEPGRNSPRQNEARAYADRALTISALVPSPDAILPCDVHLPVNTYIRKGCTVESLMTAISKREGFPHDATVFSVPSPDGAGEQQIGDLLTFVASQRQRDIDPEVRDQICNKIIAISSPSPTGAAEPDDDWEARSERSYIDNAAAEPDAVRSALAERMLRHAKAFKDHTGTVELTVSIKEIQIIASALSAPAVCDEQHIARFLTRLIYRRGVAYGKGLESEDAWVAANWRFFREDARLLGGVASAARPSIEQLCVAIADGYNNGNQQYEECDAFAQIRFHAAAESVSRLFAPAVGVTREAIAQKLDEVAKAKSGLYLSSVCTFAMADAILALSPVPDATVSAEPVAFQWRTRKPTFPPRADPWSYVDYHTGLLIKRHPEKYEVRALYASPRDVGREATVEEVADLTYEIRHSPNCPKRFEFRTCGRAGLIDHLDDRNDRGWGNTINEAIADWKQRALAANGGGR